MESLIAIGIGVMVACGVYLLLRLRSFDVILGLTLLSYAVSLFLFSMGRLKTNAPPLVEKGISIEPATFTDPLPQALVLTAIVIGFAMTAFALVLALRSHMLTGTDKTDGQQEGL